MTARRGHISMCSIKSKFINAKQLSGIRSRTCIAMQIVYYYRLLGRYCTYLSSTDITDNWSLLDDAGPRR